MCTYPCISQFIFDYIQFQQNQWKVRGEHMHLWTNSVNVHVYTQSTPRLFLSLLTVVYVCLFLYLTGCVTLISLEWFVLLYLQMNVLGMQWWIIDKELCWNVSEVICDVEGKKKIPPCFTVHSSWSDRCSLNSYVCRFF